MNMKQRRIVIRSCIVLAWIGAIAAIFVLNRGHTVFVDNKAMTVDGSGSYEAVELMKVSMDGAKGVEFFKGDRDRFPVAGSKHRIRIEFSDGRPPLEREFRLPLATDLFLLSVPKMIAGIEPFVEPFVMEVASAEPDDGNSVSEAFGGGSLSPEASPLIPVTP